MDDRKLNADSQFAAQAPAQELKNISVREPLNRSPKAQEKIFKRKI
jgi:hypothetical protein